MLWQYDYNAGYCFKVILRRQNASVILKTEREEMRYNDVNDVRERWDVMTIWL